MNINKEKINNIFNKIKFDIEDKMEKVIKSDNFPIEFLIYYDDICLKNEMIAYIENMFQKKHNYSHIRYKHLVITIFEILMREKYKKINKKNAIINTNTIKYNLNIIDKNIYVLLDYYHLYVAKNAFYSDRYDIKILDNTLEFFNKDYNLNYNVQGYYEKNNVFSYNINVDDFIEKKIDSGIVQSIYNEFIKNLDTLSATDRLGNYTVSDFLYVWSILYFISNKICNYQIKRYVEELLNQISIEANDIRSYFKVLGDFVQENINCRENFMTQIVNIKLQELVDISNQVTNLRKDTIQCILNDLIYTDQTKSFSIMEYPLFLFNNDKIIFSGFYINNECYPEIIMKKKSENLYKEIYVKEHKFIIEPRICLKIKKILSINSNFVIVNKDKTINNNNSSIEQSQIDILIFDKKRKDIMIVEVKDHVAKLDNIEVINEVNFEINTIRKGVITQLERQEKLIRIQENLDLYLPGIKVEEINKIYLGYCETYYLGTPKFIVNLSKKSIAYIPYKLLFKFNKWNSVRRMYDYFLHAQYLNKQKAYKYNIDEMEMCGYKIKIPMYEHK